MKLSIVIPVYNEQGNLKPLLEGIKPVMDNLGKSYEVIFIDDASTDASLQTLKGLAAKFSNLRIIKFAKNNGQSASHYILERLEVLSKIESNVGAEVVKRLANGST